jgi:hypothetical protein
MSHTESPAADELVALAPDPGTLSDRGLRAWTERMAVHPLGDTIVRDSLPPGRHRLSVHGLFLPGFGTVLKTLTHDRMRQTARQAGDTVFSGRGAFVRA